VFNILLNRIGSKMLAENVFYGPIRKILKRKLRSLIGAWVTNYGMVALDVGQTFPIIKKIGTATVSEDQCRRIRSMLDRIQIRPIDESDLTKSTVHTCQLYP
jgi:hypothetical protein